MCRPCNDIGFHTPQLVSAQPVAVHARSLTDRPDGQDRGESDQQDHQHPILKQRSRLD